MRVSVFAYMVNYRHKGGYTVKGLVTGIALLISLLLAVQAAASPPGPLSPPTGVNATDGAYPDRVQVTWNGVAGAGIYRVHRCSIISDECTPISYQTGTSFDDTDGKNSTRYNYRVMACVQFLDRCSILSKADEGYRGFIVSAGQSGSWYDPSHSGEGLFLQVLNDTQAAVYWFTYDASGQQLWMTGVGDIDGAKIEFPELIVSQGGKFGPDFDPAEVTSSTWGSMKLKFDDCDNAVVKYSGPKGFGDGELNVVRLTRLWGLGCKGEHAPNVSTGTGHLSAGFSGSWYDVDHSGEGFVVEILNEFTADVMWFTYDTQGNPVWLSGLGYIIGTTIYADDLQITSGGIFGSGFNPDDVVREHWGQAAFNFTSCGEDGAAGSMQYVPPPEFGSEGGQSLYRLTSIAGLECELLTSEYAVGGSMDVADNVFIDGDVNNPNTPEVSNDLGAQPQVLAAPAKLVGFVTALPTGVDGDRFAVEPDEWDVFQLPLQNGETVILDVSDWIPDNPLANDIDLYLFKADNPDEVVDASENSTRREWVSAPEAGIYLVGVHALSGTSKYLLKSGQGAPLGVSKLSSSAAMAEGELIAAIHVQNNLASAADSKSYRSRIERVEKKNALTRIKETGGGEVLYSVDTSRVDRLVPHPLTAKGLGAIKPENWQVVRAAKELSVNQDYRWSGPNYLLHALATPDDTLYGRQWHYPQINLPLAWNVTTGSPDVVVAVIDSGVHDHPDLIGNVDFSLGYDFVSSPLNSGDGDGLDPDARDPGELFPVFYYNSHGTHVAGTVGATGNNGTGVAGANWSVTLMPVRVIGVDGSGSCWEVEQGLRWAGGLGNDSGSLPATHADIINLSLGFGIYCDGQQEVIDQLASKGIIVIAAAGNESTSSSLYPAALNNVISVSATTFADELAWYSNYGSTIDLAAPGGDMSADLDGNGDPDGVLSTVMTIEPESSVLESGYDYLQGTSMASPHVAGVAALMKSVYPEMGSDEFFTAVSSGGITQDLANDGFTIKDPSFGYGRIDAQKAVNWALDQADLPIPPYLRASISVANFGSAQLSIAFEIRRGGAGDISVAGSEVSDSWMQLVAVDTNEDGIGTYHIDVDRTGLVDGAYSGLATINASDGSQVSIAVAMHVGEKVAGNAGYLHAMMLDIFAINEVAGWEGLAVDGQYDISFSQVPYGAYFLVVSSDIDNDSVLCIDDEGELNEGEFCLVYPLNSSPGLIIVYDDDIDLGHFTMTFPDNLGSFSASSLAEKASEIEAGHQGHD